MFLSVKVEEIYENVVSEECLWNQKYLQHYERRIKFNLSVKLDLLKVVNEGANVDMSK